jgi:adenylylsulfate kinase-like enzyme
MGYVAKLLSRNGVVAICVAVSPYRSTRAEVRSNVTNFIEIFVDCPVAVAESRDTEGVYAMARRGEIEEFTGVTAPYEPPQRPEVHIHSDRETPDIAAKKVITTLEVLGIIPLTEIGGPSASEEEIRERLAGLGYV